MNPPLLLALALLTGDSAASSPTPPPSQEESQQDNATMAQALATPLTFRVPKAAADAAWERARVWLTEHSAVPLASVTSLYIGTEVPPHEEGKIGFYVTRSSLEDKKVEISVHAVGVHADWEGSVGDLAAHALALYIRSGLPAPTAPSR